MSTSTPNPLLKPTRNLYSVLCKLNAIPCFRSDALTEALKVAALALKESAQNFTEDIEVKGVPGPVKEKIQAIAYNKGITVSRLLRPCVSAILEINVMPEKKQRIKIKNISSTAKLNLEVKLKVADKTISEALIEQMQRLIRETPPHLHVKRM